MDTSTEPLQYRFEAAIQQAVRAGVQVVQNFAGEFDCDCCNSIAGSVEDASAPLAYNSVNNGGGFEWRDENTCVAFERVFEVVEDEDGLGMPATANGAHIEYLGPADRIAFNHANCGGAMLAQAFRDFDFEVEWDGTDAWKVTVLLA